MLKKLLVHEWKESWRLVGILNLIVIGLTLIGTFFLRNDTWNSMDKNEFVSVAVVLYMMFFIVSVAALCMVVTFYFYIRFYRNLYTDQGYLMHTLPVTPAQLIGSKAIVAVVWMIISSIVMIASVFGLVFAGIPAEERADFLMDFRDMFISVDLDARFIAIAVLYILVIVVGQLMNLFMGYASVSIGQTFKKHKIIGAIGVYIGIYMLIQTVSSYLMMMVTMFADPYSVESTVDMLNFLLVFMAIMLLIIAALTVGFYFLTHYLMKNKLNLE